MTGLREVPRAESPGRSGLLARIAPRLAARREEARERLSASRYRRAAYDFSSRQLERLARGGHPGATRDVPYSAWNPGANSPDDDILPDLPELRARSRDLIQGDPHAAGIVDTWVGNIVGQGIFPQSRIDRETIGLSETQATEYQKAAERVLRRWARSVDHTGQLNYPEWQALILRQVFENGDVFVVPRPRSGRRRRYSLSMQTVEADRVATPPRLSGDLSIREGVSVGREGEHRGYYVKQTFPNDSRSRETADYVYVPAESETGRKQIHHLYRVLRPDQSRGVPHLAPALLLFRDLQQYFRAELIGAKVAACISLIFTTPNPFGDAAAAAAAARNAGIASSPRKTQPEMLSPGTIVRAEPGEEPKPFIPNRATSAFGDFVQRILRAIGATIQMPYELVSQDFSETTYTSGRMALTEVRRVFKAWQRWLADKILQPLWERLLEEAYLMGELPAPGFYEFFEEYTSALWVAPGWSWVDPQREVEATISALDRNLSTLADECASRGLDWEELLEQRARERAKERALGLEVVVSPGNKQPDETDKDGGETEDDDENEPALPS